MSKGKLAVLLALAALVAAFFALDLRQYFSIEFFQAKRALIGALVALFKAGRLIIAVGIPLAAELIEELRNFQVKIHGRTRQESYGAKGRHQHDDLVLALALAVFYAEMF